MDAALSAVLSLIYRSTFNLLRNHTLDVIEEGDVTLGKVRDRLMTEIEKLQQGIDAIRMKELHAAVIEQQNALVAIKHGGFNEAREYFRLSRQHAVVAFTVVPNFSEKVLSTRIQILSMLHLGFYFYPGPANEQCNIEMLKDQCRGAFDRLCAQSAAISALQDEFHPKSIFRTVASALVTNNHTKIERHKVQYELSSLNAFFRSILHMDVPININGNPISLKSAKPVSFRGGLTGILCFTIHENKLYAGCDDYSLTVWDLATLQPCAKIPTRILDVYYIFIYNNKLYYGSDTMKYLSVVEISSLTPLTTWNFDHAFTDLLLHNNSLVFHSFKKESTNTLTWKKIGKHQISMFHMDTQEEIPLLNIDQVEFTKINVLYLEGNTYMYIAHTKEGDGGKKEHVISVYNYQYHSFLPLLHAATEEIECLCAYQDKLLFAGSKDKLITVYDLISVTPLVQWTEHAHPVSCLFIFQDLLYSASKGCVLIWDLRPPYSKDCEDTEKTENDEQHTSFLCSSKSIGKLSVDDGIVGMNYYEGRLYMLGDCRIHLQLR